MTAGILETKEQRDALLHLWTEAAFADIERCADSFGELKEALTFLSGVLFGQLRVLGVEEAEARHYVDTFWATCGQRFNESNWRARNREARAQRLN